MADSDELLKKFAALCAPLSSELDTGNSSGKTAVEKGGMDRNAGRDVEMLKRMASLENARDISILDRNFENFIEWALQKTDSSCLSEPPPLSNDDRTGYWLTEHIVLKALEEARLAGYRSSSPLPPDDLKEASQDDGISLVFPSAPFHIPEPPSNEPNDLDDDTRKKLDALLNIKPPADISSSAKSVFPAPPKEIQKYDLPGYSLERDEASETWCCICNRDATLQCFGCEDDLYCEKCWKEGHGIGEGKEQGHRVKSFNWNGKQASRVVEESS
ncbi:uncharacterized protein L203_104068 [Cryptococcus depauperatus CBS 7841]|uniref:Uncharacterized protein n=1 Tax=Cryptococcus depauperatus CBS 7841 TaxID=1295531 RepID=A0AAJ8JUU9_9TREE